MTLSDRLVIRVQRYGALRDLVVQHDQLEEDVFGEVLLQGNPSVACGRFTVWTLCSRFSWCTLWSSTGKVSKDEGERYQVRGSHHGRRR